MSMTASAPKAREFESFRNTVDRDDACGSARLATATAEAERACALNHHELAELLVHPLEPVHDLRECKFAPAAISSETVSGTVYTTAPAGSRK